MLYHKCDGAACLNHEYASLLRTLALLAEIDERKAGTIAEAWTCIKTCRPAKQLEEVGIEEEVVLEEARKAKELLREKAVPIWWFDETGRKIHERVRGEWRKVALFVT